jgi:hypothetical protein
VGAIVDVRWETYTETNGYDTTVVGAMVGNAADTNWNDKPMETSTGSSEGAGEEYSLGLRVGCTVGQIVGPEVSTVVGLTVGTTVGIAVERANTVGSAVGADTPANCDTRVTDSGCIENGTNESGTRDLNCWETLVMVDGVTDEVGVGCPVGETIDVRTGLETIEILVTLIAALIIVDIVDTLAGLTVGGSVGSLLVGPTDGIVVGGAVGTGSAVVVGWMVGAAVLIGVHEIVVYINESTDIILKHPTTDTSFLTDADTP